jgi:solute carrier family 35, member E1
MTLILSVIILKIKPKNIELLPLIMVITGVILASFSPDEAFQLSGLLLAIGSNFSFGLRNVMSKMGMAEKEGHEEVLGYFCIYSFICFLIILPFWLAAGMHQCIMADQCLNSGLFFTPALIYQIGSGFSHAIYNIASFQVLSCVSTITHALSNCTKRIFVISTALFMFDQQLSFLKVFGCLWTLTGITWYTKIKLRQSDNGRPLSPTIASNDGKKQQNLQLKTILYILLAIAIILNVAMSNQALHKTPDMSLGE